MPDKRIVLEHMRGPLVGLRTIIGCESNTTMTPGASIKIAVNPHYVHYRELVPLIPEDYDGA